MSGTSLRILIADDDAGDRRQVKRAMQRAGFLCEYAETGSVEEALDICEHRTFDCVIFDYRLPGQDGLTGISAMHARFPDMPIVMSTGQGDEMVAADAMKRGASDYITKAGVNSESIRKIVDNAIEKAALQHRVRQQQEELENFARVLAHDLRAPGAAIQTYASRIADRIVAGQQEQAREYAAWTVQTAERMNRLIETLHQYTSADAKDAFEPVAMTLVLEASLANLRDLIQESGAQVTSGDLPQIFGSAPQLVQLLQNLIANAIKYCDQPQPRIHLGASQRDDRAWLFSVADNGIGIPQGQCLRIFEPFIRVAGATKRKGTGLGLATCKKIVERHRGSIWCVSEISAGSTFFFTLPEASLNPGDESPPSQSDESAESLNVDS